ncbi:MAG: hypothetical protein ACJ757_11745 [Gaiellaceae bacterium]
MRNGARAVPAWAWLGALVAVSTGVRFAFARHMVAPWIMIDEIVYSELAKSFAATGHFAVRDVPTGGYGVVYPVLISPAYALFRSIPTAYSALKGINSLLMSLAAVPAYLLARRVVSMWSALAVAVLTVAIPSTLYAGTVMTENAFYPIFLLAALALVIALERPTFMPVILFLIALALAYETRAQAVAILPAALTAPLVSAAFARRRREISSRRLLYTLVGGVSALFLLAEVVRGRSISSLLGAYAAATRQSYDVGTVLRWLLWHMAELDFYVGVVPLLALILLCARGPALFAPERAVVAATLSLLAWFGVEVAAFASQPSVLRIEERNLFYLAPLLFTCLMLWIERGLPRPRVPFAVGGVAVVALAAAIPYERFIDTSATSDTFGVLALWSMAEWFNVPAQDIRWAVAGLAAVFVAVAFVVPRRAALVLPLLVLALYVTAVQPVDSRTQRASIGALFQGITRSDRDWITAVVGSGDPRRVAIVWTGAVDRLVVNENEFFNRDVGPVYTLNGPVPGGLAQTPIHLNRATGRFLAAGKVVRVRDVLVDSGASVAGRKIGADDKKGLVLLRVDGALRAVYVTGGIDADAWAGRTATYRRFECSRGGTLLVTLGSDEHLFRRTQHVVAIETGRVVASAAVAPSATVKMKVPLLRGSCVVRFRVARTRVPGAAAGDLRRLGIRFLAFEVR